MTSRFVPMVVLVSVLGCRPSADAQSTAPKAAPAPSSKAEPSPPPTKPASVSWEPLLRFVPKARCVIGADFEQLRRSALWSERIDAFAMEPGIAASVAAAAACGVTMRDLRRALNANDFAGAAGDMTVLEAPRIGEQAVLDCIVEKQNLKAAAKWQGSTLVVPDVAHVMPQSNDIVVIAHPRWVPDIEEAIASERVPADPEMGALLEHVDLGLAVWAVGDMPSVPIRIEHVEQFAITFDTTSGLRVAAWLGVPSGQVDAVRTQLQSAVDMMAKALPEVGIPENIVRSIAFTTVEDGVIVRARASEEELRKAAAGIKPHS